MNMGDFQVYRTLLMYFIWKARNKAKFSNQKTSILQDFLYRLNKSFGEQIAGSRTRQKIWRLLCLFFRRKPLRIFGYQLDCHADWCCFYQGRAYCAGIARNTSGHMLRWFKKEIAASAMQVESKATLAAITLAKEMKWRSLLIYTDWLYFDSIYTDCPWEAISVIHDIKLSQDHFENCKFDWVLGEENRKAHDLVRLAWNSPAEGFCIFEPSCTDQISISYDYLSENSPQFMIRRRETDRQTERHSQRERGGGERRGTGKREIPFYAAGGMVMGPGPRLATCTELFPRPVPLVSTWNSRLWFFLWARIPKAQIVKRFSKGQDKWGRHPFTVSPQFHFLSLRHRVSYNYLPYIYILFLFIIN